jgi:hypothetical protein
MDASERAGAYQSEYFKALESRLQVMKNEIDALQIQAAESQSPWYRQAANIVSILALLFSFGTTVVSLQRAEQQDIQQARSDLRQLSERLSTLPRENIELSRQYSNDPPTLNGLGSSVAAELKVVAIQAADIIERIPDHVSTAECTLVATQLSVFGILDRSIRVVEIGEEQAKDPEGLATALRLHGGLLLTVGDLEGGRDKFRQAAAVFDRYPSNNAFFVNYTSANTEIYWAASEFGQGQCQEGQRHLNLARAYVMKMPAGPDMTRTLNQVKSLDTQNRRCVPSVPSNKGAPSIPTVTTLLAP